MHTIHCSFASFPRLGSIRHLQVCENVQIFGNKAAVHLSSQHNYHSLTIIYTIFKVWGWGIFSICLDIICKTMVHLVMLSYFTGENREKERQKRAEGAPPTLWRSSQRAWKSFSPFSSIILHSALSCSARYSWGRVRRLRNPYLTHDTIWMKRNIRKWIIPLPNTPVHYNIDPRKVFRTHSGMFKQDPRLSVCPTNNYYSIVIQDH